MLILQIIVLIVSIKFLEFIKHARLEKGISAVSAAISLATPCDWKSCAGPVAAIAHLIKASLLFSLVLQSCLGKRPLLTTAISNLSKSNNNKIEICSSFFNGDKKEEVWGPRLSSSVTQTLPIWANFIKWSRWSSLSFKFYKALFYSI